MTSARNENVRTLVELLGLPRREAECVLEACVAITVSPDATAQLLADFARLVLTRTFSRVCDSDKLITLPVVELVIGDARPVTSARRVFLTSNASGVGAALDREPLVHAEHDGHRIFLFIAACHAAALVVRVVSARSRGSDTMIVRPSELLGDDLAIIGRRTDIGQLRLAGAGAIGNAFAFALSLFDVAGEMHVVDDDVVTDANLNRCLLFGEGDVDKPKADRLALHLERGLPNVLVKPAVCRLQDHPDKRGNERWLHRLVTAVDSRRARRQLQEEWPREIYDASTTGIEEVVLNFHQAGSDGACLGCVYPQDRVEHAHEAHVARMLDVSIDEVKRERITDEAAKRIAAKHAGHDARDLVGLAYDTLFKELCGGGQLGTMSAVRVLAPLAFVPALAGAHLALELVRRVGSGRVEQPFGRWRVSPWSSPVPSGRSTWPRVGECVCCSEPIVRKEVRRIWGLNGEVEEGG